ncbi:MAG: DUF4337 domain-containing protein [Ancalomicrobiaceae bacterium]|nr:DUF4337 domain-containing protein [Ancalomicrobiaceae bacterium]
MSDIELPEAPEGKERSFFNAIAIAVALISAFMAVSKIKDDNIVQAMQKAQAETVDFWNEYQARRQRQFGVELAIAQLKATQPDSDARSKTLGDWQKTADTYKARAEEASVKAKGRQDDYDAGNNRDDMFDLSDALLSVSLAMFAVTALTRVRWLFGLASLLGAGGAVFGVGGFNNWLALHDSVKLLIDFLS